MRVESFDFDTKARAIRCSAFEHDCLCLNGIKKVDLVTGLELKLFSHKCIQCSTSGWLLVDYFFAVCSSHFYSMLFPCVVWF